jgi:hypothetical protein
MFDLPVINSAEIQALLVADSLGVQNGTVR